MFGAAGFPFVPKLFIPPPLPIRKPPEYFGGSAKAIGYTWHLSVVNAGWPRSVTRGRRALSNFTSAPIDAAGWQNVPLDAGAVDAGQVRGRQRRRSCARKCSAIRTAMPVTGDFNGDGVCDIGVFIDGHWFLDLNGNGRWDEGDLWAKLGTEGDLPVTGDWDGDGKTDIGIYGPAWPRDPWAILREPGLPDADNFPTRPADKAKNMPPTAEDATSGGRVLKRTAAASRGPT